MREFWTKVKPEPGLASCWNWTGSGNPRGYGIFFIPRSGRRRMGAHRFAYEQHKGPIPDGLHIDHLCRNHACVNPAHLEAVTCGENIRRGETGRRNAEKTHCKQGHEFTSANTYAWRGARKCRVCRAAAHRKDRP